MIHRRFWLVIVLCFVVFGCTQHPLQQPLLYASGIDSSACSSPFDGQTITFIFRGGASLDEAQKIDSILRSALKKRGAHIAPFGKTHNYRLVVETKVTTEEVFLVITPIYISGGYELSRPSVGGKKKYRDSYLLPETRWNQMQRMRSFVELAENLTFILLCSR